MSLIEIVLAIIFPPLPVAMRFGLDNKFVISVLLTVLGWIPGVIYALYVLSSKPAQH